MASNCGNVPREIPEIPPILPNLNSYVNRYYWDGLDFPLLTKEIGKFEETNKYIAIDVLKIYHKIQKDEIHPSNL